MSQQCFRRGLLAAVVGVLVIAPAARAAGAVPTLSRADAGASAIVEPAPGEVVTAKIQPAGCRNADAAICEYKVTADGGPLTGAAALTAQRHSDVIPVNGARIRSVVRRPHVTPRRRLGKGLKAHTSIAFEYWGYRDDSTCSVYGCTFWKLTLGSSAWCDTNGWCWGTRSRYSRVGDINCGHSSLGYSVSTDSCADHNDPSKSEFYAGYIAEVSAIAKGVPASQTHFLHRHYTFTAPGTWLATG